MIPGPVEEDGQRRWAVTQRSQQVRSDHPAALTGRQMVDSDQSDGPPPSQGRPRTRLERSKIITKHWERPDLFVRHEETRHSRRTVLVDGASDVDDVDRVESTQRWVRNFDHVQDLPPHEVPDMYSRSWDPVRDGRHATWDPAVTSRARTYDPAAGHALERTQRSRERSSGRARSRDPTPEGRQPRREPRDPSRPRRNRDPTPEGSRRPREDGRRASDRSRHRSGDGGGDRGRDRSRDRGTDWSWGRHGDRQRAQSGDRQRAQSGDRLRTHSGDLVSDDRWSRSRRRAPAEPQQRRSKSVVRFDEGTRESERRRRSRSSEQLDGAPRRGSALRKSTGGCRGVRVSFVELGDGTVLNGDWDSSDEAESTPTVAPDLLDRFFFPSDGYFDDYFRQSAGPTSLPEGRRERPRPAGPARPGSAAAGRHGEPPPGRRYHRHRTPDRNNNNRYRAKSEARLTAAAAGAAPGGGRSAAPRQTPRGRLPDGQVDYRRSWDAIGQRAPRQHGRRTRVQFGKWPPGRMHRSQVTGSHSGVITRYSGTRRWWTFSSFVSSGKRVMSGMRTGGHQRKSVVNVTLTPWSFEDISSIKKLITEFAQLRVSS